MSELDVFVATGSGLVPAVIALGIIWWRYLKAKTPLGSGRMSITALAVVAIAAATMALGTIYANAQRPETAQALFQPLLIIATIFAYLGGNALAKRLLNAARRDG
jgi:hypothetical protein